MNDSELALTNKNGRKKAHCSYCEKWLDPCYLAAHFAFFPKTHPTYLDWNDNIRWKDKVENIDYVRCQVCRETSGSSLIIHIKSHGLNVAKYIEQFGISPTLSKTKITRMDCPICGDSQSEDQLRSHFNNYPLTHPPYLEWNKGSRWEGKVEGFDYVRCAICQFGARTLHNHINNDHGMTVKEYKKLYHGLISCKDKSDKASLSGLRRAESLKAETKKIKCSRCPGYFEVSLYYTGPGPNGPMCPKCLEGIKVEYWENKIQGIDYLQCLDCDYKASNLASHLVFNHPNYRIDHPECEIFAECQKGRNRPALFEEDFEPFKLADGTYDLHVMSGKIEMHLATITRYAKKFKFPIKNYQLEVQRAILFTAQDLSPFLSHNDKVKIVKAAKELGVSKSTIRKNCKRLNLSVSGSPQKQYLFLDALSDVLGVDYVGEWSDTRFRSPLTNYKYRYDGLFELGAVKLIAEFDGWFHYKYPSRFCKTNEEFEKQLKKDQHKKELALKAGYHYLVVRDCEPYKDRQFLLGKLEELGLAEVLTKPSIPTF